MGFWNVTYTFQGHMSSKSNELRSISRLRTVILLKSDFWTLFGAHGEAGRGWGRAAEGPNLLEKYHKTCFWSPKASKTVFDSFGPS